MQIYNATRGKSLAHNSLLADSFFSRLVGLLGKKNLPRGWCLVIRPCSSVHTMFMAFPIDILFLDCSKRVAALHHSLPPFRLSRIIRQSRMVIEFPPGTLALTGTAAGDLIEFR
ncbi:MAG: hypothetical protein JL50_00475 [Peptococcaceae bacterium BICA1-7]|nr:MAG: hypothetical protein JL50_00475 [Peptococcaceae bacterium BICA1-7]HBV98138.1 DUF192 domain-containing protein [Desulfotomaculum sp.]